MSENEKTGDAGEVNDDRFVGKTDLTHWSTRLGQWLAHLVQRVSEMLGPHGAFILILFFGAVVAAMATFGAAKVYDAVTENDGVAGLDKPILHFAISLRSPWLDEVATLYTDLGGTVVMPIIAITAILVLSLRRKSWTPVIVIAGAGIGSLLMTIAGKDLIGRARPALEFAIPPYEHSPSFPSGHTLNATVIAGAIAYVLLLREKKQLTRILTIVVGALFALTIGLSRVYLGHHWFTDVLAAWMLGLAWLALVITAHRLYLTAQRRSRT
ncbi:phosphatase PAP2 family protein [Cryobacterium tepidiphilum]|uniref:Phosphatase PAP2 family protein n=1 Tax=Cryobacterium tepidiphilum TaxID=2486026 RepID=A0A3M8LNB2_9MICO|nr:phosphatase PAP2 family protein [Cryobacterium tepidiphilum]RNE66983.1 phosphatase PAP2 family protein [Cryobacterium tepidiphilum]